MSAPLDAAGVAAPDLGLREIFGGFFLAGVSGFGGVLPFARRMVVEQRRWLSAAEFADLFSLCQFLPGPNIVNFAAAFGARHRGWPGAVVAVVGLLAVPMLIVIALGAAFARFAYLAPVRHGLVGLAAAASGLMLGTALKIAGPSLRRPRSATIVALAFVLMALLRLPLPLVIALALPVSVLLLRRGVA
jgi:chromate transporter